MEPTMLKMVITHYNSMKKFNGMSIDLFMRDTEDLSNLNSEWFFQSTFFPRDGGEYLILNALTKIAIEHAKVRSDNLTPDFNEITIEW